MTNAPRPDREPRQRPGFRGPEEAYPDPPRSWARAGVLLGGWVGAWAAVFLFGLGMQAVAQAQDDDPVLPLDSHTAVAGYFDSIFVYRDMSKAATYQCSTYDGPSPEELLAVVETWEVDNDSRSEVAVVDVIEREGRHAVTVKYGKEASPSVVLFWGDGAPDGEQYCVNRVSDRESDPEPEEDPSESPDRPRASQIVTGFFTAALKDQDGETAASFQCSDYVGLSIEELVSIRKDHVHDGPGDTRFDLDWTAGEADEPQPTHELFHVVITLDDDVYEFSATSNPDDPQRCVSSVTTTS